MGPKLLVQALEPSLRKLVTPEAAQIFEAVRGRVINAGVFDKEPPGAAGMVVLVKAHPTLQPMLLDFLENLPAPSLGPWVCGGWEGVVKEAGANQRFDRLLERWTKDGGPMLKSGARSVLKARQRAN